MRVYLAADAFDLPIRGIYYGQSKSRLRSGRRADGKFTP